MKHSFDRQEYKARKLAKAAEKTELKALKEDVAKLKKPKEAGK